MKCLTKKILARCLFMMCFVINASFNAQTYSRLKINTNQMGLSKLAQLGVAVDHGIHKENSFFISDFSAAEIAKINASGLDYQVLIQDLATFYQDPNREAEVLKNMTCISNQSNTFSPQTPSHFTLGSMGGYLTYQQMLDHLDAMASLYPSLVSVKSPISTFLTYENRPIYQVKISDNVGVDELEPEVLYTAIHHAREPMSLSQTIFYMWYLLENYSTSSEIKYLIDETEMIFVPCINPDGYIYNETTNPNGGGMWRKNRRLNSGGSYGVDLNRNYSYGWGTTGTTKTDQTSDTYCGEAPFSEPETQAMRWLVQNHNFMAAFNAHTHGSTLLHPIGTTTAEFADHHDYFTDITEHMVKFNGYLPQKSSGLYPASGDSDDYMYKVDVGIGLKDTIFAMTPEIGTSFWPTQADIIPTCKEMVYSNLIMSHMAHVYVVSKDLDPSNVLTTTGNFNHEVFRLGLQDGPVTVAIEPLQHIVSVGNPIVYNLQVRERDNGSIAYVLPATIAFGDTIRYVLVTDNGLWLKRDTIIKIFGDITLQIVDNAANNANWTGTWSTTNSTFVSPSNAFTDSNAGNYANNANKTYTFNPTIDLSNATAAKVTFYAKWDIETDFDFCQFQVSTDNGTTWEGQCGVYTVPGNSANGSVQPNLKPIYEGLQSSWVFEEINLSDYLGEQIKVRFQFRSDNGVQKDGFYFDDFSVAYNEGPLGLIEHDKMILASPNPANQQAVLSFSNAINKGALKIYHSNGQLVYEEKIATWTNKIIVPTDQLPAGFYMVQLSDSDLITIPIRIVVAH